MPRHPRHQVQAVVTDMNANGLAVARVLGRHGVSVVGIGDPDSPELRSRFLRERWPTTGDLLAQLRERGPRFAQPPVLFPITDEAVEVVARNAAELEGEYRIAMGPADQILQLLDKQDFDTRARRLGLPLPRSRNIHHAAELEAAFEEIPGPWILKPSQKTPAYLAAGGQRAYQGADPAPLREAFQRSAAVAPQMVLQEYIPGGDDAVYFCLLARSQDNQVLAHCSGRKLRQWRPGTGGTSACEPVEEPALLEIAETLFRDAGVWGLCSMEFKRDARDGSFVCIEPTVGRSDWQNGLADANGLPLPYLCYLDRCAEALPHLRRPWLSRRWVHWSSDRLSAHHYRQLGRLSRFAWLWSLRPPVRGAYFAVDDLGPYLARLQAWLRRRRLPPQPNQPEP